VFVATILWENTKMGLLKLAVFFLVMVTGVLSLPVEPSPSTDVEREQRAPINPLLANSPVNTRSTDSDLDTSETFIGLYGGYGGYGGYPGYGYGGYPGYGGYAYGGYPGYGYGGGYRGYLWG